MSHSLYSRLTHEVVGWGRKQMMDLYFTGETINSKIAMRIIWSPVLDLIMSAPLMRVGTPLLAHC